MILETLSAAMGIAPTLRQPSLRAKGRSEGIAFGMEGAYFTRAKASTRSNPSSRLSAAA